MIYYTIVLLHTRNLWTHNLSLLTSIFIHNVGAHKYKGVDDFKKFISFLQIIIIYQNTFLFAYSGEKRKTYCNSLSFTL